MRSNFRSVSPSSSLNSLNEQNESNIRFNDLMNRYQNGISSVLKRSRCDRQCCEKRSNGKHFFLLSLCGEERKGGAVFVPFLARTRHSNAIKLLASSSSCACRWTERERIVMEAFKVHWARVQFENISFRPLSEHLWPLPIYLTGTGMNANSERTAEKGRRWQWICMQNWLRERKGGRDQRNAF